MDRTSLRFPRRIAAVFFGLSLTCLLCVSRTRQAESQGDRAAEPDSVVVEPAPVASTLNPAHVMGARACLDCHKSEYAAWMQTVHYDDQRLEGDRAEELIAAYGGGRVCLDCHRTPQLDRFGRVVTLSGVSCESCHGAAGGPGGWLNRHAVYGPNLTRMEQETAAHYESRIAYCDRAGMIRTARIYELAKNCYGCHIVGDETLLLAGHKPGQDGFELIPWIQGEVRHNFHMDPLHNAEVPSLLAARFGRTRLERQRVMFVVDLMVRMEVSLRNFAAADPENLGQDYARAWVDRAEDAMDYLEEGVLELLEDADIDDPDVTAAFEAADELDLGRGFDDQAAAAAAADVIGRAARSFAHRHDGSQLDVLDENWEFLGEPKGDVFQR